MERTVNYLQLFERLASEKSKTVTNLPDNRRKLIKTAMEKFKSWTDSYIDIVNAMIEKYENDRQIKDVETARATTQTVKTNIFNQTFLQKPVKEDTTDKPTADPAKITKDVIDNWYKILVYTADREASRKARRTVWLDLTNGKFTTVGTARLLRESVERIVETYKF